MKKILILGSSGSIGINTLDVIRRFRDLFEVEALAVNTKIDVLEKQIEEFQPKVVVVKNQIYANQLRKKIGHKVEVLEGEKGLIELTSKYDYDILVGAMVGFSGLIPTIEGIKRGKRIALANKETLVVAGELINKLCEEYDSELIPVDSEHSAIFQCLIGEELTSVKKLILTASGGPFLNKSKEELSSVTIKEALNHPNWKMGNKITIDSASMINKGLEIIEAHWLFKLLPEQIEVVIHPQSIVHSMVEFIDGSIKAQMSFPDMRLPIQFALTFPKRLPSDFIKTNLPSIKSLTFFEPDFEKYECLKLAYKALEIGGTTPCILNASNEIAVGKFLNGKIKFTQIPEIINKSLEHIENHRNPTLEEIIECDFETRKFANSLN